VLRLYSLSLISALILGAFSCTYAQDFVTDAQNFFVDSTIQERRFGIEIEFYGLPDSQIESLIIEHFQARLKSRTENGAAIFETPFGEVKLVIEGQAWRYENDPARYQKQLASDKVQAPREIVFPPLFYKDIPRIEGLVRALKARGALGTDETHAVSTQVNVEMPLLTEDQRNVDNLVNLMKVYFNPEHAKQAQALLQIPVIRREYIKNFSDGFLQKLANPQYQPTARELFDDYFYRQSLEALGFRDAWSLPIQEARDLLLAQPNPVMPQILKMVRLRVSSLILLAFADDPLAEKILASRWIKPVPVVEYREFNTDFDIRSSIDRALGLTRSAQLYGNYDHDELIAQITGIIPQDLKRLRERKSHQIVRYMLQDPGLGPITDQEKLEFQVSSPDTLWIQLSPQTTGQSPLVLPGESIVYHRRHIHKKTIQGLYNPGLENELIQQVMENKIFEAKLLNQYAPGVMPRTLSLPEVLADRPLRIENLKILLDSRFPEGWVMKGAWDLGSELTIITDSVDIGTEAGKADLTFERKLRAIQKKFAGLDPETLDAELKELPGYLGWKIKKLLLNPSLVMIQSRLKIKKEFRVEVQGGQILGNGSTVERYAYLNDKNLEPSSGEVRMAEEFVRSVLRKLPSPLQAMPFGFDVALLDDGSWAVIETNAGGNSSFLDENAASSRALVEYLKSYPEKFKNGEVRTLSPEEQMQWIKNKFKKLGINPKLEYPGMKFYRDHIDDPEFPEKPLPKSNQKSQSLGKCQSLLQSLF